MQAFKDSKPDMTVKIASKKDAMTPSKSYPSPSSIAGSWATRSRSSSDPRRRFISISTNELDVDDGCCRTVSPTDVSLRLSSPKAQLKNAIKRKSNDLHPDSLMVGMSDLKIEDIADDE